MRNYVFEAGVIWIEWLTLWCHKSILHNVFTRHFMAYSKIPGWNRISYRLTDFEVQLFTNSGWRIRILALWVTSGIKTITAHIYLVFTEVQWRSSFLQRIRKSLFARGVYPRTVSTSRTISYFLLIYLFCNQIIALLRLD